jgi:hypothetical protein
MPNKTAKIPVRFTIASFEAIHHTLPDGREFVQPRHWRLLDADGKIVASGPYETESDIQIILECAGEFMQEHPERARQFAADKQHIRISVPLNTQRGHGNLDETTEGGNVN